MLKCFEPLKGSGRVINPRLKAEWDAAQAKILALSEAGKRGALIKQQRQTLRKPTRLRAVGPVAEHQDFAQFWSAYPKKEDKKEAQRAFDKAMTKTSLGDILPALGRAIASEQWTKDRGKYIPLASTWLNKERWTDQPTTSNGSMHRPPPFPPKTDPIARGQWRTAYGDPAQYGYE